MAQRGNFRGKRHSPYFNRNWKDRRPRDRPGDNNFVHETVNEVLPDNNHEQEQRLEPTPLDPALLNEKGKREKKFGSRSRLYIGNLLRGTTEAELKQLFNPFGETGEIYLEKEKSFAFIRLVSTK